MHTRLSLLLALFAMCGRAADARADDPESARAEARRLARLGDAAFSEGRCDEAISRWHEAEARFHAPSILVRVAQCESLLGRLVEASATLEQVVKEPLAADAPTAFVEARSRALDELPRLRARIARIRIAVDRGDVRAQPRLEIDHVRMATPNGVFRVNPGSHFVELSVGSTTWERSVKVGDGDEQEVRVSLAPEARDKTPWWTQRRIGYLIGATGMASVAVGTVMGILAIQQSSDLDGRCGQNHANCSAGQGADSAQRRTDSDAIDAVKRRSLISDVAFGAGALLFAGGAVLVLTDKTPKEGAPRVRFVPTGAGAAVVGSF